MYCLSNDIRSLFCRETQLCTHPLKQRGTAIFLKCLWLAPVIIAIGCITGVPAIAQMKDVNYEPVLTPEVVSVNHTQPKGILKAGEVITAAFSKAPTDEEIYRVHFFEEPLVPVQGKVSAAENKDLVLALAVFSQRTSPDDFTAITQFLKAYPKSRWNGALLANLGIVYRRTGYYNGALDAWQQAWTLMKKEKEHKAKVLADKVMSDLLLINCWVGRYEAIDLLLKEISKRTIEGPAEERIAACRAAFSVMKDRAGISFKCGPFALNKLFTGKDSSKRSFNKRLMDVQSTSSGFSLAELDKLSQEIGLNYQMAFRNPGAPVIENAVVHWKLDHYSALLKREDGHYKCEDATMGTIYGQQFWLTPAALDSSASGYFLVPKGALPNGWRTVSAAEGSKVFGKGVEPPDNGKHTSPCDDQSGGGCSSCSGMARANVHLAAVSLQIADQPLFYHAPKGPQVDWKVSYHQRDSYQPANFSFSNFGPKWTFDWLSYIQDDPNNLASNADLYVMGGGTRTFTGYDAVAQRYAPELQTNDVLVRIGSCCFELRHPDGSKEMYQRSDGSTAIGRRTFLTKHIDVNGDSVVLSYDSTLRIVSLKDALGQITTINYGITTDIYKITKVTDPFGRSASFLYDGTGKLASITDMIGMVSSFTYDAGDFITQMKTPYGITRFTKEDGPGNYRSLQINHPLGAKERVEYAENAPGIPSSEAIVPAGMDLFNSYLTYRNTFYWDKKAMLDAPGDYTKAKIYHWLHGSSSTNESGFASPILESVKEPLENRVWYNYQGQSWPAGANQGMSSSPSIIGRVLTDGTTQLQKFSYNVLGKDTLAIDPVGRRISKKYDSTGINLLEVRQTRNGANELLLKYTYDPQHPYLVKTATDAAGQTTTYTYNTAGQLLTATNPRKEKTSFYYKSNGYLDSIVGPVKGAKQSFTYDGFGRRRTIIDAEGYVIRTDYDAFDRPTVITYPDSTFEQSVYDRLDPVATRDRMGRWSHSIYDSLDRVNAVIDPLGLITQFIWCACGNLSEIVDPSKHVTSFQYDVQSRIISKLYDDNTTITYKYDSTTSRLSAVTDPKGQITQYSYYSDDNIKQVDYINSLVATPSLSFSFDDMYNRVDTMKDGTGTTAYFYYPVISSPTLGTGMLQKIDGPLANDDIVYTYDSLGRVKSRTINGVASSLVYDALGRITSSTNVLGTFTNKFVNTTARLSSVTLPNSTTTAFTYFNNTGDQRLKEIWNKNTSTTISKFNYEYNPDGEITKWIQQAGSATPNYYELAYDLSNRLTAATQKSSSNNAILKRYGYQYDKAGNRISEQLDNTVTSALYNTLNQMTAQQDGGPMRFKGTVSEFASVVVKNNSNADSGRAFVDSLTNSFEAFVKVVPGTTNNVFIIATDSSGNNNRNVDTVNVLVGNGINNTVVNDANGNTVSTTNPAVSYSWDALNRLVKITKGGNITEFVYDGLNRRVKEKLNGSIVSQWVWCGFEMCEERSATNTVTKRFFSQGEQINGVKYYYALDHLGSVRELVDASGNVAARYDYDPYGRRTKILGTIEASYGFAGMYYHGTSNLNLTLWRAYDANLGRWLSKDPMEYAELLPEGPNLYTYVGGNPLSWRDPLGLYVKGTPTPISPSSNSIICKGGVLVVQNNNTGPGKECTQAHEGNHIKDWINRYGPDLCKGVPDGQLPLGGPGYADFLKKSECEAYKVGKKCREDKLKNKCIKENDKKTLEDEIERDNAKIQEVCGE